MNIFILLSTAVLLSFSEFLFDYLPYALLGISFMIGFALLRSTFFMRRRYQFEKLVFRFIR